MMRQTGLLIGAGGVALSVALAVWFGQQPAEPAVENPEVAAVATPAPAAPANPEPPAALPPEAPRFDVVRVDGAGLATIAGSASPDAKVSLRVDGLEVAQAIADAGGQFAALVTLSPSDAPRILSLVAILADGTAVAGVETVALAPVAAPEVAAATTEAAPAIVTAPAALLVSPEGVQVLQPPTPSDPPLAVVEMQIDSISYGSEGEVVVGGQSAPQAMVRLYLDDKPVADTTADGQGDWRVRLASVDSGLHVLRADQIDAEGKVLARFETPFKREAPAQLAVAEPAAPAAEPAAQALAAPASDTAPVATPAPITITVQPGLTLWAIAKENFGDGVMYVQVFEANRDKIKDPDLIYPGQVFNVPKP